MCVLMLFRLSEEHSKHSLAQTYIQQNRYLTGKPAGTTGIVHIRDFLHLLLYSQCVLRELLSVAAVRVHRAS